MKNYLVLFLLFSCFLSLAQSPNLINYQGVARNVDGPIEGEISLRISVLNGATGPELYSETHQVLTWSGGLFSLLIGGGDAMAGAFESIDWSSGEKFLQVEMDAEGGSDYQLIGISQLVSVPYALYANEVENVNDADADPTNELELPEQVAGDAALVLTADGTGGVSYTAISSEDADADPTNEIELPEQVAGDAGLVLTADGTGAVNYAEVNVADADDDPVNEIQDISTDDTPGNITLSDGSTLALNVEDSDADDSNEIQDLDLTDGILTLSNDPTPTPIIDLEPFLGNNTDDQVILFDGTSLTITGALGGNTIDISGVDNQNAIEVIYDNAGTNLSATDVQEALNELDQNQTSNSWQLGGNSPGTLSVLGTYDNSDLSITANGTELIRVAADGNIGIGVEDPSYSLHVVGNTTNSNELGTLETIIGSTYEAGMIGSFEESDPASHNNVGSAFIMNGSGFNYGSLGLATNNTATHNRGLWGIAANALNNRGIQGHAYGTETSLASIGVFGFAEGSYDNWGVSGNALGVSDNTNVGMRGLASNSTNGRNIGVYGAGSGDGIENWGGEFFANSGVGTTDVIGVIASASGASTSENRGGSFSASNSTNGTNTGVYASAYGIGTESTGVRGLAYGDAPQKVGVEGTVQGAGDSNWAMYGHAVDGDQNIGVYGVASLTAVNGNIGGRFSASASTTTNFGVRASALGEGISNIGMYSNAQDGSDENTGVFGNAQTAGNINTGVQGMAYDGLIENRGINGIATGATGNNLAVHGNASGTTSGINYGIYASALNGGTNYAGYFVGDVTVNSGDLEVTSGTIDGTIVYDNASSGLVATNVQDAIDELDNAIYPGIRTYLFEDNTQQVLNGDTWQDLTGFSETIDVDRDGSSIMITVNLSPLEFSEIDTWLAFRISLSDGTVTQPSTVNTLNSNSSYINSPHLSFLIPNVSQG